MSDKATRVVTGVATGLAILLELIFLLDVLLFCKRTLSITGTSGRFDIVTSLILCQENKPKLIAAAPSFFRI